MNTFDRKFKRMISGADGVPEGFDGRVEARLASLPERRTEAAPARTFRPMRRRAAAALAAVLAVCLISGTALAVSPTLRELLWGGFEPYVQNLEPTAENTHVYDNVEARIVSALSDGYINAVHVELRDLEGDRAGELWREYQRTGVNALEKDAVFSLHAAADALEQMRSILETGKYAGGSGGTAFPTRLIGFDGESGVLTLELGRFSAAPEREKTAKVEINTGALGTEPVTVRHENPGVRWKQTTEANGQVIKEESGVGDTWTEIKKGWVLTCELAALPVRTVETNGLAVEPAEAYRLDGGKRLALPTGGESIRFGSVKLSQLGVTLCAEAEDGVKALTPPAKMAVVLKNGEVFELTGRFRADFNENSGESRTFSWLFPSPVDPESVASLTLGGVEIPLN